MSNLFSGEAHQNHEGSTMKNVLIVGIGSRIMMDDAIGICLVEDLRKLGTNPYIRYLIGETDVDYCIGEILDYDYVIIIDAFLSGNQPGFITVVPLNELKYKNEDSFYSMHGLHLLNIIRCAKQFPDGIFIGIEPYEINYGFTLSDLLQSIYSHILLGVQEQFGKYIEQYEGRKNA